MGKIIGLIRSSTTAQEIFSQREEVISMILDDGYNKEDIIIVGDAGASAIKVDEQYLANLNKVYELIETGEIDSVYCWAVDRIGRTRTHLNKFREFLVDHKVQLIIKNPQLKLLNDDGSENTSVGIAFSVFIEMAVQEMKQKQARFERGKKRNMFEMKSTGGNVPLGYKKDKNGYIVIDETTKGLVELIFKLFNSGKYSTQSLAKELNSRGYRSQLGNEFNNRSIAIILKNKSYTGSYTDDKGRIHNFPQIINNEEFNKVKPILASNNIKQGKTTKHNYFAIKLIKCKCGSNYCATKTSYTCAGYLFRKRVGYKHLSTCTNPTSISFNNLDGILWKLTKDFLIEEIEQDDSKLEEETKEQISILQQKIQVLEDKMKLYDKKIDEIVEKADRELRSEEYISKRIANVNQQREKENRELVKLNEELRRLNDNLQFSNSFKKWFTGYNSISEVELKGDEKVMRDLVHRYISNIQIERVNYKDSNSYYKIDITSHKGVYSVYYYCKNGLLNRCYINYNDKCCESEFYFERIIRKENKITTNSNEIFKKFKARLEKILPSITDMELIWKILLSKNDNSLSKLYHEISKTDSQRIIHYLNEVAIDIAERQKREKRKIKLYVKHGNDPITKNSFEEMKKELISKYLEIMYTKK